MKIYNTLSKRKEEFIPLEEGKVKMYVCGPTVYNLIHIGNARPMIVFDTVRRYMEHKGYEVNFVSNFTDVDDKIIKKAVEEGVDSSVISERYIEECKKDMEAMNVRPATTHPKATQEIDGMLEMIETLIRKGHAYAAQDGTVYFRTRSFQGYGKLSHKNLDDLQGGNRSLLVTGEDQKEDPLDFVLWKPKKEGEPYWEAPWCDGRPGWHIECSVMSKKYLGDEIDIHAGGEDLVFPHHENEIAQSEAANERPFSRYWMHNAFLNIDNRKMSKSVGNFFTVRDIGKRYDLQVFRFFMLSAHYRSPLNFSAELMEAAANGYDRIVTSVSNLNYLIRNVSGGEDRAEISGREEELLKEAEGFARKFDEAMEDDFNTADAIAAIFELVKFANTNASSASGIGFLKALKDEIVTLSDICGLIVDKKEEILDSEIEALIDERQAARKEKNFKRADEIRNQLLERGIVLEDTREGVKWKRA
ncbi:MAG: cysteine--tRNA ligase [Lachnospiraceae bacterium]|nr:cysteine--tRNA ligase [Lachnospiraceae bacterium]